MLRGLWRPLETVGKLMKLHVNPVLSDHISYTSRLERRKAPISDRVGQFVGCILRVCNRHFSKIHRRYSPSVTN